MNPFDVARELRRLRAAYRCAVLRGSDVERFAAWVELSRFVDRYGGAT